MAPMAGVSGGRQPARCARAATSPNPEIAPRNFARLAISADKCQLKRVASQATRSRSTAVQSKYGIAGVRFGPIRAQIRLNSDGNALALSSNERTTNREAGEYCWHGF